MAPTQAAVRTSQQQWRGISLISWFIMIVSAVVLSSVTCYKVTFLMRMKSLIIMNNMLIKLQPIITLKGKVLRPVSDLYRPLSDLP